LWQQLLSVSQRFIQRQSSLPTAVKTQQPLGPAGNAFKENYTDLPKTLAPIPGFSDRFFPLFRTTQLTLTPEPR
jgi:hypothetical protein